MKVDASKESEEIKSIRSLVGNSQKGETGEESLARSYWLRREVQVAQREQLPID